MKKCYLQESGTTCCTCPERISEDMGTAVDHWMKSYQVQGFSLGYDSLALPGQDNRLCQYGTCRICGKCLCIGFSMPEDKGGDVFLATVFRWTWQLWSSSIPPALPEGAANFRQIFLALFHEQDKAAVSRWLEQPENQSLLAMYRNTNEEGIV